MTTNIHKAGYLPRRSAGRLAVVGMKGRRHAPASTQSWWFTRCTAYVCSRVPPHAHHPLTRSHLICWHLQEHTAAQGLYLSDLRTVCDSLELQLRHERAAALRVSAQPPPAAAVRSTQQVGSQRCCKKAVISTTQDSQPGSILELDVLRIQLLSCQT